MIFRFIFHFTSYPDIQLVRQNESLYNQNRFVKLVKIRSCFLSTCRLNHALTDFTVITNRSQG
jgi:hypothetical protein